jgi:hypothetical protein
MPPALLTLLIMSISAAKEWRFMPWQKKFKTPLAD